jgi:hypothetical protein
MQSASRSHCALDRASGLDKHTPVTVEAGLAAR